MQLYPRLLIKRRETINGKIILPGKSFSEILEKGIRAKIIVIKPTERKLDVLISCWGSEPVSILSSLGSVSEMQRPTEEEL